MRNTMRVNEQRSAVATAIHMIQCNIVAARYGIVSDDTEMILEAINQIDAIISDLKRKTEDDK